MIYNSVILSFILNLINKLIKIFPESYFVKFLFKTAQKLKAYYENSVFNKTLEVFIQWISKFISSSLVFRYINKQDILTVQWENSYVFKILFFIISAPSNICRKLYEKNEDIFNQSYFIKLLKFILCKFEIVIGLFILIILIVPDNIWNNSYSCILIFFILFLYFIKTVLNEKENFNLKIIDPILLLFIITVFLSSIFSIFPKESMKYLLFYSVCFILLLIIVSALKTTEQVSLLIEFILVGVAITGLYGIYQRIVGVPVNASYTDMTLNEGMAGRIFSTMGNPNNYAELLVLTIPFYFAAIFNSKTTFKKCVFSLLSIPAILSLVFTYSRSGWGSLVIALFVIVLFKNWKLIPWILALGVLLFPLIPIISPSVYRRILTTFNPNDTSINYRVLINSAVSPMFNDFWLTGVGLGSVTFMYVCQRYDLSILSNVTPPHTHNLFNQIWIEVGLIGLLTFIWFILRLFIKSIREILSKTNPYIDNILIASIASIVGIFVLGNVEYVWFYNRVLLMFWINIAIILVCLSIVSDKATTNKCN